MKRNDFRWKGTLASEMGVILREDVMYRRPARRVTTYQVAGRSGSLIASEPITYEDVVYTPACALRPGASMESVNKWLMGEGELVFGTMPGFAYQARITDAFDVISLADGHPESYALFSPVFVCDPLRLPLVGEEEVELSTTDTSVYNAGNVPCWPLIRVMAAAAGTTVINLDGQELTIVMPSAGAAEIDTQLGRVLSQVKNVEIQGNMPQLPVGAWQGRIVSGEAQVALVQRQRFA